MSVPQARLSKVVVGLISGLLLAAIGWAAGAYQDTSRRLVALEVQDSYLKERDQEFETRLSRIEGRLLRIEVKLDNVALILQERKDVNAALSRRR